MDKVSEERMQWLWLSVVLMILGGAVYVWFRSSGLVMFTLLGDKDVVLSSIPFRTITISYGHALPDWFLYSLPDGLWLASYLCLMAFLWRGSIKAANAFWYTVVPVMAIASEFAQLGGYIPGTFDPLDVACYVVATLIPLAFLNTSKHKPTYHAIDH